MSVKFPVQHQNHPAYPVIEKALAHWPIIGGSPSVTNIIHQATVTTNALRWLESRGFDLPSLIDWIIESLIEGDILLSEGQKGRLDLAEEQLAKLEEQFNQLVRDLKQTDE